MEKIPTACIRHRSRSQAHSTPQPDLGCLVTESKRLIQVSLSHISKLANSIVYKKNIAFSSIFINCMTSCLFLYPKQSKVLYAEGARQSTHKIQSTNFISHSSLFLRDHAIHCRLFIGLFWPTHGRRIHNCQQISNHSLSKTCNITVYSHQSHLRLKIYLTQRQSKQENSPH